MKAIVLAAGVGSRLGNLTADRPKCLIPILGKPLLDYWFDAFVAAGIDEILINLHHHADQVRDHLAASAYPLTFHTLYEPTLLGSAGTIRTAWEFVEHEESFFIIYADNFAQVDLKALFNFHVAKRQPPLSLLTYVTDEPRRCGILELDAQQRVISFEEKPDHPKSNIANAGLHVASRQLIRYLPDASPADLGFHVLPQLVGHMFAYITDEYIQDIGTPEQYAKVQRDFAALKT